MSDFFVVRRSSTALSNKVIHNQDLSFPALGLLMASLALPPNAPAGYRAFLGRGMGEKAVRTALRELETMNHRFRFRIRREGQIRELTIVSDAPISKDEARAEIVAMMSSGAVPNAQIGECVSHPEPKLSTGPESQEIVDNHRAADGAARCDQQEHDGENSTVPRSSAARSRTAQPTDVGSKDSSLRSESPTNQPAQRTEVRGAAPDGEGEVGGQIPDEKPAAPDGGPQADWDLIERSLPKPMLVGFTEQAGRRITAALNQAKAAGWLPSQFQRALNNNPLPSDMSSPIGLVIHRVEALAATRAPARRRHQRADQAQPAPQPVTPDELRHAVDFWRTADFGTPEFRQRRLTETLRKLAEVDPGEAQKVREHLTIPIA